MELHDIWFVIIAFLWTGYFFLEGFDFGVGVLTGPLARDRAERRVLLNTIGPVWDGNEVWLITAAGATFAAFPEWYATLFSGFYLPLLAVLVCLIVRGVAFEYRHKRTGERWQARWERAIFWASLVPAVLWGVLFANLVRGVPIDARHEYVGGLVDLFHPYALLGGLVTLALFTFHGAVFTALKTVGPIRARARRAATGLGAATLLLLTGFLCWTLAGPGDGAGPAAASTAVAALLGALAANARGREGWAFALSGVTVAGFATTLFVVLFPAVMPSSLNGDWSLTVANASSSPYTLEIITWLAAVATPLVLLYQGWTYWVFRKRIGTQHIAPAAKGPSAPAPDAERGSPDAASGRPAQTGR